LPLDLIALTHKVANPQNLSGNLAPACENKPAQSASIGKLPLKKHQLHPAFK
jgi:hypothetical protein